ncbi:MAG: sigma-70 family RNA polymerase sigma factor [Chloroflexota bacterium]
MASPSTLHETELVILAQRGDRNAFGELVQRHSRGVLGVAYRLCGESQLAEDAAQETFLRAWLNLSGFHPQTSLRNWLYRIAVNAVTDMLRKDRRLAPQDVDEMDLTDPRPGPESRVARDEGSALVTRAVLSLPEASRAALVLKEYEGLSYQEIAGLLDIPLGTVMSRLNYARKRLKEILQPQLSIYAEVEND